jgi:hypothetical protein
VTVDRDLGQAVDAVDVDQVGRRRQPQLHHREQALASGQYPPFVSEFGEQRHRLVDRRRGRVLEWCWIHR